MTAKGFLSKLISDQRANTLAIGAAAILPLVGVIGGGLDISRSYLIQTRLQQACDAATLAARKELAGGAVTDGTIPAEIEDIADSFFNANFSTGMYGSANDTFELSAGNETRMDGVATSDVPMVLMQIFGFNEIELNVECSAELNLPNIDVVLVLDQSGSMNTGSRMQDLREAVFDFYDEIHAVKPAGSRVRIGVVPYSGAVNVGRILFDENPDYIADEWNYQSRVAEPDPSASDELYSDRREILPREPSNLGSGNYDHYRWATNNNGDNTRCNAYDGTYTVNGERWVISNDDYFGDVWGNGDPNWRGACQAQVKRYRQGVRYRHLEIEDVDTSVFKTFTAVSRPVGPRGVDKSSTWNGCIEERATIPATDFDPIPEGAFDLDIHLVPDNSDPDTQWKPMWPQITFYRPDRNAITYNNDLGTVGFSCPSPARRLLEAPLDGGARDAGFENYINGLRPTGDTMHDIGMIWAGRFLSSEGIFADDNAVPANGEAISRHIIFMTDGEMHTLPTYTTSYGNPNMDGLFAGFKGGGGWSEPELRAIHYQRLAAICNRIKNDNVTIWSIAFGIGQNSFTRNCATGNQRAFEANDASSLSQSFRDIAGSIAELRLVQ